MRLGICVNTIQAAKDQTASVMIPLSLNWFLSCRIHYKIKIKILVRSRQIKELLELELFSVVLNAKYIRQPDLPSSSLFLSCEINYLLSESGAFTERSTAAVDQSGVLIWFKEDLVKTARPRRRTTLILTLLSIILKASVAIYRLLTSFEMKSNVRKASGPARRITLLCLFSYLLTITYLHHTQWFFSGSDFSGWCYLATSEPPIGLWCDAFPVCFLFLMMCHAHVQYSAVWICDTPAVDMT